MDEVLLSTLEAYHIALCRAFDLLDAFAFLNLGDYSPCDSLIVFAHCSRLEWLWFNCKKKRIESEVATVGKAFKGRPTRRSTASQS